MQFITSLLSRVVKRYFRCCKNARHIVNSYQISTCFCNSVLIWGVLTRMPNIMCFQTLPHHSAAAPGASAGPPTGPGGRPPGLFVTHAQWVGGRPFRFSARAGRVGVVLKYIPGRAGGRSIFRPGARGRRPVFDLFLPRDKVAFLKLRLTFFSSLNIRSHLSA
jgi:hypothetical protein